MRDRFFAWRALDWRALISRAILPRGRGKKATVTLQIEALEGRIVPATATKPAGLVGSYAVNRLRTLDYEAPLNSGNAFQQAPVQVPTTSAPKATASGFQITLRYTDNSVTASQKAIFSQAAQRWSEVIVGDLPDGFVSGIGAVDDLVVSISAPNIDGRYGVLGQAGPTHLRNGSNLPLAGIIEFDRADMAGVQADGSLYAVAVHEIGHILGLGTIWDLKGLIVGAGGSNPRFVGKRATAEYQVAFNTAQGSVPVENTGGSGTRDAHWRESIFGSELMTGYINSGNNPLSRITVASMADLGYTVNLEAADPFKNSGGSGGSGGGTETAPTPGPGDAPGQLQYTDINGDGKADLVFQTASNSFWVWTGSSSGFGSGVKAMQHGATYRAGQAQYADVNGDGKADLIFQGADNSFYLSLSNGTTFGSPQKAFKHGGAFVAGQAHYRDINGDGRADLVFQNGNNVVYLSLSTGTSFTGAKIIAQPGGKYKPGQAQFADVNGDGKSDMIFQGLDNAFWLYLASGSGFAAPVKAVKHGGAFRAGQAQYADVDGDGKADLIFQGGNNSFWLSRSTGATLLAPVKVLQHGGIFQPGQAQFADVTGDGRADRMFQSGDNSFWLSQATGTGFSNPTKVVQRAGTFVKDQAKYADVNGDGQEDLLFQDQSGLWLYFA
ncbi:MAG: hypothetical protein FJ271_03735 [Planctomycetes bacterium]|nr:hypothetical protein [Planctomycetota bacterium]